LAAVSIDASLFKKMFLAGAMRIESKKEIINELNVFPVPDGDTGTNMTLTIQSAVSEVNAVTEDTIAVLSKAMSSGSLRGARGNSGVILSQIFRGFSKVVRNYDEIDVPVLKEAVAKSATTAYKAVMAPKEGTILTVIRSASEKAAELADDITLEDAINEIIDAMQIALDDTPNLLPVLKEAGVVDSGGTGLLEIALGMRDVYLNPDMEINYGAAEEEVVEEAYCVNLSLESTKQILMPDQLDIEKFIDENGECYGWDDEGEKINIHFHSDTPGAIIDKLLEYGKIENVSIDYIPDTNKQCVKQEKGAKKETKKVNNEPPKENGFIAVSVGAGIEEIFKEFGVDCIISGGQTMNPSTEDILKAIDEVNAKNIFVLPNNGNIILAASQARDLTKDKNIVVIPSKTIPQGISAMISFLDGNSAEENEAAMTEALEAVKTVEVTYAVRDTSMNGKEIHVNDIMGICGKEIVAVGEEVEETSFNTVKEIAEDAEMISIYYGEDINESDAEALKARIEAEFTDAEVAVYYGGQPVYYYIISVE